MMINISIHHSVRILPDNITVDPRLLPVGNPFKYHVS